MTLYGLECSMAFSNYFHCSTHCGIGWPLWNAQSWRRMCTCTFYKRESDNPCHALAVMAMHLATSFVDPDGLAPFLASHLVALDKMPGVRPIGVKNSGTCLRLQPPNYVLLMQPSSVICMASKWNYSLRTCITQVIEELPMYFNH